MKIKRLWVSEYKNLKNIDLKFNSDLVSILVGKNGLGKSNLIEILALIFRDLDLINKKSEFENWPFQTGYFEFSIHYECYLDEIKVELRKGFFSVKTRPLKSSQDSFVEVEFEKFLKYRKDNYLPKYVIGYYSGENKRIGKIIKKHEDLEKEFLKNFHSGKVSLKESSLRRVFFTENSHSQLLLLTLALYRNSEVYGTKIQELLSKFLRINRIVDFQIVFNNPKWKYTSINGVNKGVDFLLANIAADVDFPFWNVKGKVDKLLTRFYNHQIENSSEPLYYENDGEEDLRPFVKEFLIFENVLFEKFLEDLAGHFEHPLEFFDALEATSVLDILNKINLKVEKEGIAQAVEFEHLSEGEQQLLTVLGLVLVTGKDDCLFLLDEPDTHLNPEWQRDYIKLIENFNLNDLNSHILIATHSPLIVQSSESSDVFLFKEENGEVIIDSEKHQIHNWRIDQVMVSEYFNLPTARPAYLDEYMNIRLNILTKRELDSSDRELLKKYENKFGVLPTGESIEEIEAMILIKSITQKNDQA